MGMSSKYFVYDGRANYDIDSAQVLMVITATSNRLAIRRFKEEASSLGDCVLVDDEENILENSNGDYSG